MHMSEIVQEVHISTQAMGTNSREKKSVMRQEPTSVPDKKECFACKETSHTLDQCGIKYKLVSVAQMFGHSTRFPFYMIQPSEEVVENEKFYHRCLMITSNVNNLDPGRVKSELNRFWKLTDDWEIRREGRENFLASFNSEDDLISCLKLPNMETSVDDKEVEFTVARWSRGDEEKLDLVREWILVYGVPRTYRNWKELYQVASAVGMLIEVDEESLESGDKEPIRLRIALDSPADAPYSYKFVFGWSSRLVKFIIEDEVKRKELEEWNGEEHLLRVNNKYEDKREIGIEETPKTLNKEINSESSRVTSTGNYMLDFEGCSDKGHEKELKSAETATFLGEPKLIEELIVDGEIKENNISAPAAATTNSKRTTEDSPKAEGTQSKSGSSTTGNNMLDLEGCLDKEHRKELKITETAMLLEEPKFIEELIADGEIKESNIISPSVTTANSEKTTEGSPKAEARQSISGSSTSSMIGGLFRGIQKPAIKNVYERRKDRRLKGSTEQETASKELNKGMNPGSSSHTPANVASTCNMLDSKSSLDKEHEKELKMVETALLGKGSKSTQEFGGYEDKKDSNIRRQTARGTLKAEGAHSVSGSSTCMTTGGTQTKGVGMSRMESEGAQFDHFDGKQHVFKMNAELNQNAREFSTHGEIYDSFIEMDLQENLLKGIYAYGLDKPSAVHQRGVIPLCKGLDVIHQSLSGTTVTLGIGVLQRLNYGSKECQALVLVPTRDLAQETEKAIGALGRWLGVKAHACFGGTSIRENQQILSSGVQIIIGTPGRVLDMLRKGVLCPDHIRMFFLDEADEILTGGFKGQVQDIIQLLPTKIQVGVFSAAMSPGALEFCCKFMNKPLKVIVPIDEELEGTSIKQFYVKIEKEESKLDKLCYLLDTMGITRSIIFVNTRRKVKLLAEKIRGKCTVSVSHGGMDQQAKDVAFQELQSGSSRVLVATDLWGTDALQVPVIINYDLPTQPVHYLRHVRRSGHSGGKGVAISFVTRADERVLSGIQKFCNTQIGELPSNVTGLLAAP